MKGEEWSGAPMNLTGGKGNISTRIQERRLLGVDRNSSGQNVLQKKLEEGGNPRDKRINYRCGKGVLKQKRREWVVAFL